MYSDRKQTKWFAWDEGMRREVEERGNSKGLEESLTAGSPS